MTSKEGTYLMMDEKKMRRMISNRESAKRSRMKKEKHIKDLNDQIFYLMKKRDEMVKKIEGITKGQVAMEMENMVLRSQKQELEKRLEYAKTVCGWYEGSNSIREVDVQEPWLRPWDHHRKSSNSMPPVMSSAGLSKF